MSRVVLFMCVLAFCMAAMSVHAQTLPDDQRRRVERELHQMTPEEIQARLRQAGISQSEAIQRARMEGIGLEEYLSREREKIPSEPDKVAPADPLSVSPLDPVIFPKTPETTLPVRDFRPKEFSAREAAKELDAFGYNIFRYPVSTFEPVLSISPPKNYLLGSGDELIISVWGEVQFYHALTINRDGYIIVPDVGQIMANGLTLERMRERLLNRMSQVYSSLAGGANALSFLDVSIGKLRTIQVFVLGDVRQPGGYTVSSMSTAFKALYFAGGPSLDGSMRNIRVMRNNTELARIDFYEYALKGDQSGDIRLEDGDIIFVPPVHRRVAVAGRVVRPAVYEIGEDELLGDVLKMAGGLVYDAYIDRIHIERVIPFGQRRDYRFNLLDIDIIIENEDEIFNSTYRLEAGDVITFFHLEPRLENRVRIIGNVFKPGVFELSPGMTVRDVVQRAGGLLPDTFAERATIVRTLEETLRKEIIPIDLEQAMDGDRDYNHTLQRLDELYIYSREYFFPSFTVTISGEVRKPGTYNRADSMTVEDLIVLAGGATEEAELNRVIVSRIDTLSEYLYSEVYEISVDENYWQAQNPRGFILSDFDHVTIPPDPRRNKQQYVQIKGQVMYPGRYAIERDDQRLTSYIERAGGFREGAYLEGAQYLRMMEGALRLVPVLIKTAVENPSSVDNIIAIDQDEIHIPRDPGVILVRGAVNAPVAVAYQPGKGLRHYIRGAGGYAEQADKGRTTVTLPNGRIWEPSGWFLIPDDEIKSGSIIYVPEKTPKEGRSLEILRNWTTLMASTAAIIVGIVQITK